MVDFIKNSVMISWFVCYLRLLFIKNLSFYDRLQSIYFSMIFTSVNNADSETASIPAEESRRVSGAFRARFTSLAGGQGCELAVRELLRRSMSSQAYR